MKTKLFLLPLLLWGEGMASSLQDPTATVEGTVQGPDGAVEGATVRVRATPNMTRTGVDGAFRLAGLQAGHEVEIAAWKDGFYVATTLATPPIVGLVLTLRAYHTTDNPEYAWTTPVDAQVEGSCIQCHPMIVEQWRTNAHGSSVSNPRFFSMYNGTDTQGAAAGGGYVLDFPNTSGNCANCHAPGAGIDGYLSTNMNEVRDNLQAGIHCDYCHKIGGVFLDPATESVYPNSPGVRSQRMLRPPAGDNIFFGPYDDIHDPDTYLPLVSESAYCAPCHQFSMWGTPIYESYNEWLSSPYRDSNITCQSCHMPPNGDRLFALPEKGGLDHPPEDIPSHLDIGARDLALLQSTITLELQAFVRRSRLQVEVNIVNSGAGHHVPTDFPGRQMILVLQVVASDGSSLPLRNGPTIPEWGGSLRGHPGKVYAKLLRSVETGKYPVVTYWKQTLIESDNRIPALQSDVTHFEFDLPPPGDEAQVTAHVHFRRVFAEVDQEKQWGIPDFLMAEATRTVRVDGAGREPGGEP